VQQPGVVIGDDPVAIGQFRADLLQWFDRHARVLPWRDIADPYATWVSEIMLQQTQVATVIDYFERWMQRFPTVSALADAELDDVLGMWEGLGYYRRARYLHRGAQMVRDELGGELPSTSKGLRKIPGIGPYTAGAIASIAFGESTPAVDGNVIRVVARLLAEPLQPKDRADVQRVWSTAEALVDPQRPGDFNQALMELGATVCTPKGPTCLVCPVREHCQGFATGEPTRFPEVATRAKVRRAHARTAIVVNDRQVLLERRPSEGLLAGLWQFPALDDTRNVEELDAHLQSAGVIAARGPTLGSVDHRFSHIAMTIEIVAYSFESASDLPENWRWVAVEELGDMALSRAMRKVEEAAARHLG
jgi:A/G-specific adenine glycosylase